jgi:hypothetical protein
MFEALANPTSPSYQSVKLPAALVSAAKESAQTFRRSTSGQIEYWAALGRKLEKNGLTISQAGEALQRGDALMLEAHMAKMKITNSSGSLKQQFHTIIDSNQRLAA